MHFCMKIPSFISAKRHFGPFLCIAKRISMVTYVNKVRIEKAVELLKDGQYSIKAVAELTGYDSLNNFYKYFKIYMGVTPAAYCQKLKAGGREDGTHDLSNGI